jgi:hypothetical protein
MLQHPEQHLVTTTPSHGDGDFTRFLTILPDHAANVGKA